MKHALATTVSRRGLLSRLLMAAAMAPVVGVGLADTVEAGKKTKKQVKKRVESYRSTCTTNGGTAEVIERPGGTTVSCTGQTTEGTNDWACTVTKSKPDRCHATLTNPPATKAGGGGAVPPGDGGNEDPTGGGNNPGGGAHVPPGGGVDPNGGGSEPVLE